MLAVMETGKAYLHYLTDAGGTYRLPEGRGGILWYCLVTCHLLPHLPYHLRRKGTGHWEVLWLYQVIPRLLHHLQGLTRRGFDL